MLLRCNKFIPLTLPSGLSLHVGSLYYRKYHGYQLTSENRFLIGKAAGLNSECYKFYAPVYLHLDCLDCVLVERGQGLTEKGTPHYISFTTPSTFKKVHVCILSPDIDPVCVTEMSWHSLEKIDQNLQKALKWQKHIHYFTCWWVSNDYDAET